MLDRQQMEIINHAFNPKFLATMDRNGKVNLSIITSLKQYKDLLVFGNLFMWKTTSNLKDNQVIKVLAMDTDLNYFTVEGTFLGFEETGEIVDHLNNVGIVRYNAYTSIRSAGKIAINSVSPVKKILPSNIFNHFVRSRLTLRDQKPNFPYNVAEKFSMLKSIKAITYQVDDKIHLHLIPALNVSGDYLFGPTRIPSGLQYAACVISLDVVAFQIKGVSEREGLRVDEIFASGPPVAGKRIYPLEKHPGAPLPAT